MWCGKTMHQAPHPSLGCTRRSFCRLRGSATTTSLCKTTKPCFRIRSTAIALSRARTPFRVPLTRIASLSPTITARGQSNTTARRTTRRATSLCPNACLETRTVIAMCARPMAARNRVPKIARACSVRLPATARQTTTTLCVVKQPPTKKTAKSNIAHGTTTSAPTRQVNVENRSENSNHLLYKNIYL